MNADTRYTENTNHRLADRVRNILGRARWALGTLGKQATSDSPVVLGSRSSIVVRNAGAMRLGAGAFISPDFSAFVAGSLIIGDGVFVGRGAVISCFGSVTIGDAVRFGERVSIHDENHVVEPLSDLHGRAHHYSVDPVVIGDRVWLGANVVVLPGAEIGDDTVVAAGSVVRGKIPPRVVAAGVPASVRRSLS